MRFVKRSSTCCRSPSVTAVLRPLISILTVDLLCLPKCRAHHATCRPGDAPTFARNRRPRPRPRRRRAAPSRRRRGSLRSCRRRPPGSPARRAARPGARSPPRALSRRSTRARPTCGRPAPGAAHRTTSSPVSPAEHARRSACAWSKPRLRLPPGWPGTGTSTPASSSPAGARAAIAAAMKPRGRVADTRLQRHHHAPRDALVGERRPGAGEREPIGARPRPGRERHEPRRRSRCRAHRLRARARRHATHSGGTTSEMSRSTSEVAIAHTIPCRSERLTPRLGQSRRMTAPEVHLAVEYTWSLTSPRSSRSTLAGGAYAWRLRDLRRTPAPRSGDRPAHDTLRALAFAAGLAVVAARARLPARPARRGAPVHGAHGPAPAARRPRPDPAAASGSRRAFLRPAVRRLRPLEERLGPLAHPAVALVALRGADVAVARARDVRAGARPRLGARARARVLLHRRHRVLVVPDRAGAAAPPPHGPVGAGLPDGGEAPDGRCSGWSSRSRPTRVSTTTTRTRRAPGA